MVRLRVLEILAEQKHTKYWLWKQMEMIYQNFNRIVNNETSSIRFDNLDKISQLLNVPVGDLFEQTEDAQQWSDHFSIVARFYNRNKASENS